MEAKRIINDEEDLADESYDHEAGPSAQNEAGPSRKNEAEPSGQNEAGPSEELAPNVMISRQSLPEGRGLVAGPSGHNQAGPPGLSNNPKPSIEPGPTIMKPRRCLPGVEGLLAGEAPLDVPPGECEVDQERSAPAGLSDGTTLYQQVPFPLPGIDIVDMHCLEFDILNILQVFAFDPSVTHLRTGLLLSEPGNPQSPLRSRWGALCRQGCLRWTGV